MTGISSSGHSLPCPKCAFPMQDESFPLGGWAQCPACSAELSATIFPALAKPPTGVTTASGERADEGEAVCFFHPEKRAAATCDRCGRFLCALCDVPFGGRHLCPSCLDSRKLPELQNRRLIWSRLAFFVGIWPILLLCCYYLWIFTGPAAVIIALIGWNKPPSLVHGRMRGRLIVGLLAGLLQIALLVGLIWGIAYSFRTHG